MTKKERQGVWERDKHYVKEDSNIGPIKLTLSWKKSKYKQIKFPETINKKHDPCFVRSGAG